MQRTYIMSDRIYKRILRQRKADKILCERCKREIKIGDKVLAKLTSGGKFKYYHLDCWHKLFIEI